jgi:poly(A) polymerase/tRNA nucleotidyltransferase (CCA-adding enzyme)
MQLQISKEVLDVVGGLRKAGFKAFIVGGSVRDVLIGRKPKDWDVATDAKPEEIQKIFPDSVYENAFGTVGVKTRSAEPSLALIEVTTFRHEDKYTDFRHPDKVEFAKTIEEDLARRDFTINALALDAETSDIIDPFGGQEDLKKKIVKAVGDPEVRFNEDALRLVRAVRFAAELKFEIEGKTAEAIKKYAHLLEAIAKERIRDEFVKIVMSDNGGPAWGVFQLEELGLLKNIIPELQEGIGVGQNKHHIYTVWDHNLRAFNYSCENGYDLEIRLASLLHDVGKPRVKAGDGPDSTFYAHEMVGAKMTAKIMDRLHFSKKISDKVIHLVRQHLFYYNVGEVTEAGVRRFLSRVGVENVSDLLKVREADRIGSGVPKAVPYKMRHLLFMIEKVKADPISPKMLKINGSDLMKILGISPGPRIGWILAILLEEVLDDPNKNIRDNLESRVKDLEKLSDSDLLKLSKSAHEKKEEFESGAEEDMKRKFYVK